MISSLSPSATGASGARWSPARASAALHATPGSPRSHSTRTALFMVEQVDIGDPTVISDASSWLPGFRFPAQPINRRGPVQTCEEVVGTCRHPALRADVDPERLDSDQLPLVHDTNPRISHHRLDSSISADTAACRRTLRSWPDKIHHGPADDPQRVGLLVAHLAQLVLTDVLDVAAFSVRPVDRRRAAAILGRTAVGTGIITWSRSRRSPISRTAHP